MPNSFVETRFDLGIIPRGVGGITYKSTIIRSHSDFERRNVTRAEWLFEGDIGEVLLDEKQTAYVIAFFNARRGKAEGFRYRYWGDYTCTQEPLELNPSSIACPPDHFTISPAILLPSISTTTQGILTPASSGIFQLQKKYVDAGDTSYKTITKPVEGTVKIYESGNLVPGAVINYTTGHVIGVSGTNLTWEGEFDLPVWFDTDVLPGVHILNSDGMQVWESEKSALFRFESLPIIELPIATQLRFKCENGKCLPDPTGVYASLAECEAALIPAGFTGGQCINVGYHVVVEWKIYSYPEIIGHHEWDYWGSISGLRLNTNFNTDGYADMIQILCHGSYYHPFSKTKKWENFYGSGNANELRDPVIKQVIRIDGNPDNCGDPPPICSL